MEKSRKNLKEFSYLILILMGLSLIRSILDMVINGVNVDTEKTNLPEGLVMPVIVITVAISFILYIPQLYIGLKGLKLAKDPSTSPFKAPIVWAMILLIASIFGVISAIQGLAESKDTIANILSLANHTLDVCVYFLFVTYAKQVIKGV
jgi:hypothetical protein